jgi:hypothetical protein
VEVENRSGLIVLFPEGEDLRLMAVSDG